jgi:NADPH:quinone reductase-like Zn-dependent oxidoreductase
MKAAEFYDRKGGPEVQGWGRASMSLPRVVPRNDGTGKVEMAGPGVPEAKVGERVWVYQAQWDGRAFGTVVEYVVVPSANAVTPPVDVPLDRVAEAHPLVRTAGVGGKILLDVA